MKKIIEKLLLDPRYLSNIEYGEPRPGHPEGQVKFHIAALEANLERMKPRLKSSDHWKLKFLIHVHDACKAEARRGVPVLHPSSHASLARAFAGQYTNDPDLLNMIQYHDEYYALWRQMQKTGQLDQQRFDALLNTIKNWDLFLAFMIIDSNTVGKDLAKLIWFISEVKKHRRTRVDESWILEAQ